MKKTLVTILTVFACLSTFAMAHCGDCEDKKKECAEKKCSEEECAKKAEDLFNEHDADKDGKLSMDEFKAAMAACKEECKKKKKCKKKKCDKKKKKCDSDKKEGEDKEKAEAAPAKK